MTGPLLDARGLSKAFTSGRGAGRRSVRAVADVDLAIEAGERDYRKPKPGTTIPPTEG